MKSKLSAFVGLILCTLSLQAQLPTVTSGTLKLWLRADAGVITNSAGRVSQWQDQSGALNHASQTNAATQPLVVNGVANNNPVIRFDGIQDGVNGDYLRASGNVGISNAFTSFLIYSCADDIATEKVPLLVGTPNDFSNTREYYIAGDEMAFSAWGNDYHPGYFIPTNTYRLWELRMNTNKSAIELFDRTATNSYGTNLATHSIGTPSAGYYVGGLGASGRNHHGDIAELVIYSGQLTDADRISVENYLLAKYYTATPVIIDQPGNRVAAVGSTVTLTVNAGGSLPLSYLWSKDGAPLTNGLGISGVDTATVTLSNVDASAVGSYSVFVTNSYGSVQSASATLTVLTPVSITGQPQSQSVIAGNAASFSVSATGDSPQYQWRLNADTLAGATNSSLSLTNVQTTNAGSYSVLVFNGASSALSSNAVLIVNQPPVIVGQPSNRTVASGTVVSFTVSVIGDAPMTLLWSKDNAPLTDATNIYGTTSATLTLSNVTTLSAGDYSVLITNSYGSAQSVAASLMVVTPVSIVTQPQSQNVVAGTNVTFTVSASGDSPKYQWRQNSIAIAGATSSSLQLTNVQPSNAGSYSVRITNEVSSVISLNALLTVGQPPVITSQPQDTSTVVGGTATFSVAVQADTPSVSSGTLRLWLKADAGVVQSQGLVSQWLDQSGFTNDCVQSDTNKQPLLVAGAANGNSVIRFDGLQSSTVGDYLQGSGQLSISNAFTSFLVYKRTENNPLTEKVPLLVGIPQQSSGTREYYIPGNEFAFSAWANDYHAGGTVPTNTYCVWTFRLNTNRTSLEFFNTDGVTNFVTSVATGGLGAPGAGYYVGGLGSQTRNFKGDIAEILIYKGTLTETDRTSVQNYLGARYLAGGGAGVAYQWYFNGVAVTGGTNASLTLTNVQLPAAGNYYVLITNSAGAAVSSNATLTVNAPPTITADPQSQTKNAGSSVTLTVAASGTSPLAYQWLKSGSPLGTATNSTLTFASLAPSDAASYQAIVSNPYGSVTSAVAVITVNVSTVSVHSTNGTAATTLTLPIDFVALGNENALGFSLAFDPTVLTFNGVTLGQGLSGVTLIANSNQVSSGKLGLAVALSANNTFTAGSLRLLQVTFNVAPVTTGQVTSITFSDVPTVRQIANTSANTLSSSFFGGTVAIAAADFEGDVSPRPTGDHGVTITDWVQVGRFAAGLDTVSTAGEFQRADCAPRNNLGNGSITVTDWVQAGRYAAGVDPLTPVGGPISGSFARPLTPVSTGRLLELAATISGGTSNVSIKLAAQGDENALGFSLSFNPAILKCTSVTVGSDATGAILNVNTNQVNAGQLGIALALGTGDSFPAGTKELVKVCFTAITNDSASTSIGFSDTPVVREASDVTANTLSVSYSGTSFVINPAPILTIGKSGSSIALSWPASSTNYVLESSSALDAKWNTVTNDISTNAEAISVNIPVGVDTQYYRLKK